MSRKADARTFGQDLMRGEHVVGGGRALSESTRQNHTASLKDGLTFGLSTGPAVVGAGTEAEPAATGTSIFDPVLCELAYRWFCPPGGLVLDPFAGGSVRGIVAGKLGRQYTGIELRAEQVAANEAQARAIMRQEEPTPQWIEGDSRLIPALLPEGMMADLVFSCPPYADLELYSDVPRDLSNMPWPEFVTAYRDIIAQAVARLSPDRFAVWVIGDVRDKKGFYRGLPWETVQAFDLAGARLYNEAVLVTAVGSLPLRTRKQFESGRKTGKTHQNVFVFCKGSPQKATAAVGPVEFGDLADESALDEAAVAYISQSGRSTPFLSTT